MCSFHSYLLICSPGEYYDMLFCLQTTSGLPQIIIAGLSFEAGIVYSQKIEQPGFSFSFFFMILEKALGFVFYSYILGLAVKFTCFLSKIIQCTNVTVNNHWDAQNESGWKKRKKKIKRKYVRASDS